MEAQCLGFAPLMVAFRPPNVRGTARGNTASSIGRDVGGKTNVHYIIMNKKSYQNYPRRKSLSIYRIFISGLVYEWCVCVYGCILLLLLFIAATAI